jgi:hypothetical protein
MAKKKKIAKGKPPKARAVKKKPPSRPMKKKTKPSLPAPRSMPRADWFDKTTQHPLIERHARQLQTFIDTMADGRVDESEIDAQEKRLVKLMKEVDPALNDQVHAKVTQLLCELTAYDLMQIARAIQDAKPKTVFQG